MENSTRTGYIDFKTSIDGTDTDIKILETFTHVFIYVNQIEDRVNLYDNELKKALVRKNINRKKEIMVFCNLKDKEKLESVADVLHKIFTK